MPRLPVLLIGLGLLLGGCVAVPCANNPGATCYAPVPAQPVVVGPSYPYPYSPAPAGVPYAGPDGLTYVDGYPVETVDGDQVALVFVPTLGGWGYYDHFHNWRGAPPGMRERLDHYHPGGLGIPPPGAYRGGPGRPPPGYGGGPYRAQPGGQSPGGPPPQFRSGPGGPPPQGGPVRPAAVSAPPPVRRPPPPPPRSCPNGQQHC